MGIAGGSGSGKTWLAERLGSALQIEVLIICLDDFYLDRSHLSPGRRESLNFDHPRAIDWKRVELVLSTLRSGCPADLPGYDFKTHCRLSASKRVQPRKVILVDGLWPLRRPALRTLFDLGIFLSCPATIRLRRRLERDTATRGRTAASVRRQFSKLVEPMHKKHVLPQRRWADVVLTSKWGAKEVSKLAGQIKAATMSGDRNRNRC